MMIKQWGLVTAEILYRMPDHRNIVQTFVWQDLDEIPEKPRLLKFLGFWTDKLLEAPIVDVRVMMGPFSWQAPVTVYPFY